MIPAVPLRGPDDLFPVLDVEAIFIGVVAKERLAFLVDYGPRLSGRGIDFDDAIDLVAALVVFKGKGAAVLPPDGVRHGVFIWTHARSVIGIGKQRVVDYDLLFGLQLKKNGLAAVEHVPGLFVFIG